MSAVTQPGRVPVEGYLAAERAAKSKSYYVAGEVFARSGISIPHNIIASNLVGALHAQLKGRPCYSFTSDIKVWVERAEAFFHPDAAALCGVIETFDERGDTITNPSFIAEILSESTEGYDRGDKFDAYASLPSFREYLLVSQTEIKAERRLRNDDDSWELRTFTDADSRIAIPSLECELRLGDLFDKVEPRGVGLDPCRGSAGDDGAGELDGPWTQGRFRPVETIDVLIEPAVQTKARVEDETSDDRCGLIPRVGQDLGKGRNPRGKRILGVLANSVTRWIPAGEEAGVRGQRDGRRGRHFLKAEAVAGEPVQSRRGHGRPAAGGEPIRAGGIEADQEHVTAFDRIAGRPRLGIGRAGKPDPQTQEDARQDESERAETRQTAGRRLPAALSR